MKDHTVKEIPRTWQEMTRKYSEDELYELIESGAVTEVRSHLLTCMYQQSSFESVAFATRC